MERKFVKSRKNQRAAELRLSANVSIQETKVQVLPDVSLLQVEDYEKIVESNASKLREQSHKELLLFPDDDFTCVSKPRLISTAVNPTKVCLELLQASSSFTEECIKFYQSDYITVKFKYADLSCSYFSMIGETKNDDSNQDCNFFSKLSAPVLKAQRFEFDELNSALASSLTSSKDALLVKQGYLWKTPFNKKGEKSFFTKNSFKKRFFSLQQLPDGSYALNYWKDEKKDHLKGCLNLEGCSSASKMSTIKTGFSAPKFVIELHFVSKHVLQIATESESDQEEWVHILQRAITTSNSLDTQSYSNQSTGAPDDESYGSDWSDFSTDAPISIFNGSGGSTQSNHTLPRKKQSAPASSMATRLKSNAPLATATGSTSDPNLGSDIQRYCKETDRTVAEARKKDRLSLFSIYSDMNYSSVDCEMSQIEVTDNIKIFHSTQLQPPYQTSSSAAAIKQVLVQFEKLDFPLKVAQDGSKQDNMEPFFTSICLYDVPSGVKVSEDVWIDSNPAPVWKMIKHEQDLSTAFLTPTTENKSFQNMNGKPHLVDNINVTFPKCIIFTIPSTVALENLSLYVRVEKILQGAISNAYDVYGKVGIDHEHKAVQKYLKQLHMFCHKFGSRFRTPFCWTIIPLTSVLVNGSMERKEMSSPLIRIDPSRTSFDAIKRNLQDARTCIDKPEKLSSRFSCLPDATIKFAFQYFDETTSHQFDVVNPFLVMRRQSLISNLDSSSNNPIYSNLDKSDTVSNFPIAKEAFCFSPFNHVVDQPYNEYFNTLFMGKLCLKFDSQKVFSKARNIACSIRVLSDDTCQSPPLNCIYNPVLGQNFSFTNQYITSISHHNVNPEFPDEIKIEIPPELSPNHHILFSYYHVSCDQVAKMSSGSVSVGKKVGSSMSTVEANVGYSWVKLSNIMEKGQFCDNNGTIEANICLPVAASINSGYLSLDLESPQFLADNSELANCNVSNPGSSSVVNVNSIQKLEKLKFLDSGKRLFSFNCKVKTSVFPHSKFLRNLFSHSNKCNSHVDMSSLKDDIASTVALDTQLSEPAFSSNDAIIKGADILQYIKAAHAIDENEMVAYLPIILDKLVHLITVTNSDVQINIIRFMVHIAQTLNKYKRIKLLKDFITNFLKAEPTVDLVKSSSQTFTSSSVASHLDDRSIHYRTVSALLSLLSFTSGDEFFYRNLMQFLWVFFDIIIKSMALYVIDSKRTNIPRGMWFNESYYSLLQQLVSILVQQITERIVTMRAESELANQSVAFFLKNLLSVTDRGVVFGLIKLYWNKVGFISLADGRGLVKLRIHFLKIISTHEHFVPLSLPIVAKKSSIVGNFWPKDFNRLFNLNEDFFNKHFLTALVLGEVSFDMNDIAKVRSTSIVVLRDLMAKLSADYRYENEEKQSIIITLFIPILGIVVQNVNRLARVSHGASYPSGGRPISRSVSTESLTDTVFPLNTHPVDNYDRKVSVVTSAVDYPNRRKSSSGTAPYIRFDILETDEVRNLLLTFLHVLKYIHPEVLTNWWDYSSDDDQFGFLTSLKICLDCFQYDPTKSTRDDEFNQSYNGAEKNGVSMFQNGPAGANVSHGNTPIVSNRSITLRGGDFFNSSGSNNALPLANSCSNVLDSKAKTLNVPYDINADKLSSLKDANLATETGLVVLDIVDVLATHFRKRMESLQSGSVTLTSLFEIYLGFLRANHSEKLLQQTFASMRLLISKFPMMLFKGDPCLCGRVCFELIRCFSARLESTRYHSCMLLYLLMRSNFIFTARSNCTRVNLQSIVAVSQLVADVSVTTNPKFQESLALVNNLAASDRGMIHTKLPGAVNELTKTMRKVLIATSQMKEHEEEPEMLLHLQHSLADSYAGTPELRQTWLESMAKIHISSAYYSEAAMCYLHVAAMHAEYLKAMGQPLVCPLLSHNLQATTFSTAPSKGLGGNSYNHQQLLLPTKNHQPNATAVNNFANNLIPTGKDLFKCISTNIEDDERAIIEEKSSFQDDSFSHEILVKILEVALENFWLAQRFELVPTIIQIILPFYEKRRMYEKLIDLHEQCGRSYMKMMEVYNSGKRFLATYFRVAFYGKIFGSEDGQQYIYKEPNVTSLASISERLNLLYTEKYGSENFKLLHDSTSVPKNLDPRIGFVQITHVEPYIENYNQMSSENASTITDFDLHNNVCKFVFEAPFTRPCDGSGDACRDRDSEHGNSRHAAQLNEQYIRKTVLKTKHAFPYVEKRILVEKTQSFELSPIEVACESLRKITSDLRLIMAKKQPDMKRLQLKLQGCVGTQVNAGPLAYAKAFLEDERQNQFAANKVKELKKIYIEFVSTCSDALDLNGRLIKVDQFEFHENLKFSFKNLVEKLSDILKLAVTEKGTLTWKMSTSSSLEQNSAVDSSGLRLIGGNSHARTTSVSSSTSQEDSRRNSARILTEISKTHSINTSSDNFS